VIIVWSLEKQSVVEMTKDLVLAQIQSDTLLPEDMQEALGRIHQSMLALKSREESGALVSASIAERPHDRSEIVALQTSNSPIGFELRNITR
jgi:hypothetical protein